MAPAITPILLAGVSENISSHKQPTSLQEPNATATQKSSYFQAEVVWSNVAAFAVLHIGAVYGAYLFLFNCMWSTFFWAIFVTLQAGFGITAGAHRLWTHRSYKAKWPLRAILATWQTIAYQNSIYEWARDHRTHHKFSDSNADPHNIRRGFFFSHMGWLMMKKHPDVGIKGKTVDLSDLLADPIVRFQRRYFFVLMPLACFVLPAVVPWWAWGEDGWTSFLVASLLRWTLGLHGAWLVNSAAHLYGMQSYDVRIEPRQNWFVSRLALGEGWHNFHHAFPWDYKAAELPYHINWTTRVIDAFARIGWAYDMKTVSADLIRMRVARTGDGTWQNGHTNNNINNKDEIKKEIGDDHVWGWDDKDISKDHVKYAHISNKMVDQ